MRRPPDELRGFLAAFDPAVGKLFLAVLAGTGARIRHVRIARADDLAAPALRALLRVAVAQGRTLVARAPAKPASRIRPTTGAKRRPKR